MPWATVDTINGNTDHIVDEDREYEHVWRNKVRILPFLLILVFAGFIGCAMYSVFVISRGGQMHPVLKKIEEKVNGKPKLV